MMDDAWKDPAIPQRHWDIIAREREMVANYRQALVPPYRAFCEAMSKVVQDTPASDLPIKIIEIGAATGFYDRVLKAAFHTSLFQYTALDYSPAFRDFAAKVHPDVPFLLGDATDLPLPDAMYDVAVSGCCVLHISNWEKAISEAVRVSKKYVLFHRTPLMEKRETFSFQKEAYGVQCMELSFNKKEFLAVLKKNGLKLVHTAVVFEQPADDYGHYSLLTEKK